MRQVCVEKKKIYGFVGLVYIVYRSYLNWREKLCVNCVGGSYFLDNFKEWGYFIIYFNFSILIQNMRVNFGLVFYIFGVFRIFRSF